MEATVSLPTRQRLIAAALELFAERGYEGTSVGEIESAAGLVPRSGALYKHFPSKRALLGAALAERMDAIDRIDASLDLLPLGDLRSELTMIGRMALEELESERLLARIVMKEGDRFPEIAADFHHAIVARGRALGIAWLESRALSLGVELADPEATGEALVDALVARALKSFMFGDHLAVVDRERYIDAWVELGVGLLATGSERPKEAR
ncbi:MAG TPA: helix-turn-helix domain-containing protein [Solirubrobacterales bacterium]|nr:helix-turn-helix domain-containing protein [Solirubrobacterales bacterium]